MEFELISKRQWVYFSICFIVLISELYDFSVNDSISIWVMLPIDIAGGVGFWLFLREMEETKEIMEK